MRAEKRNFVLSILGVSLFTFLIWNGFSEEHHKITECRAVTSKWVVAEYSSTTVGLDFNGNMTSSTEYWDKPASEVYTIYTINGVSNNTTVPYGIQHGGVAIPSVYPTKREKMSKDYDFDKFSYHTSNKYYVFFEDGDYTTQGLTIHSTCMERRKFEKLVTVHVWYGIKRTIDLDL